MILPISSSTTTEPKLRPSGSSPSSTMKLVGDHVAPAGTDEEGQTTRIQTVPRKYIHPPSDAFLSVIALLYA